MKLLNLFFIFGLVINVFLLGLIISTDFLVSTTEIEKNAQNHISALASYNDDRISNFLEERKLDIEIFQERSDIQKVFDVNIWGEVEASKKEIERIARDTTTEIDDYLIKNSKKTIKELQEDDKFLDIFNEKIGEEGYFILIDSDSLIGYYHPEERRINYNYDNYKFEYPDFWNIITRIKSEGKVDGIYSRADLNGIVRDKYMYSIPIKTKTLDNKNLSLISAVYLDEYTEIDFEKMAGESIEYFNRYNDYSKITFIDKEGKILINSDLADSKDYIIEELFTKLNESISFDIIEIVNPESGDFEIFLSSPYFTINSENGEEELNGFLIFEPNLNKLNELIYAGEGLDDFVSISMIDSNNNIIASNNLDRVGEKILITPKNGKYKNEIGINSIGVTQCSLNAPRCIIVEVDYNKLVLKYFKLGNYILMLKIFFVLCLLEFIIFSVLDRAFELKIKDSLK